MNPISLTLLILNYEFSIDQILEMKYQRLTPFGCIFIHFDIFECAIQRLADSHVI